MLFEAQIQPFSVPLFVVGHLVYGRHPLRSVAACRGARLRRDITSAPNVWPLEQNRPAPFDGARDFVRRCMQSNSAISGLFSGKWYTSLRTRNDA
jgi:hypothetical protein